MAKTMQEEIQQSKPFPSLQAEAFLSLLRTADQLQARVAQMLKAYELSPTQYNALRILRGAGAQGLTCSEVGGRMIKHDPDITRLLDRLQRRKLIVRGRERQDRRVIRTRITPAGLELLQEMDEPVEKFQRDLLGHVGERGLRSLIRLLEAARASDQDLTLESEKSANQEREETHE